MAETPTVAPELVPLIDESFGLAGLVMDDRIVATNRATAVVVPLPFRGKVRFNGR